MVHNFGTLNGCLIQKLLPLCVPYEQKHSRYP
jgi:hypothetical protein